MMVRYKTYTFIEAYKAMKEEGSWARCAGYPFVFCYRDFKVWASENEGDSWGILPDFNLWNCLWNDPSWLVSTDGLTWKNRKGETDTDY